MRREIAEGCHVPGRTDRGLEERRGGAPRGVAVCLYLPAIRETSRGLLPLRLSALRSLFFLRGHPEPPNHVKKFAGSDDARLPERKVRRCAPIPPRRPGEGRDPYTPSHVMRKLRKH